MKQHNLPKYLFYTWLIFMILSIIGGIFFDPGIFATGLTATAIYLSPVFLIVLILHKFFNWNIKNNYFYGALVAVVITMLIGLLMLSNVNLNIG